MGERYDIVMKTLRVNIPQREYDILIGKGIMSDMGKLLGGVYSGKRIIVVTDDNVGPLYAEKVKVALKESGYEAKFITVAAGEASKSIAVLESVYSGLLEFGITRTDLVVALGGGVVGDLTGFAAATLLRGIPFVQIPTTLLAQVDSSVGGKVAVNLAQGKNLAGAFYQPKMVIIDTDCLLTLTDEIFADGMAEVIKYAAIEDAELFEVLECTDGREELFEKIQDIVYTCCDIKRRIVEADERDLGGRMVLNFGHTFGHAIEKKYNYSKYTHGMAVAAGMVMATQWGESRGITECGTRHRIEEILKKYSLPIDAGLEHEELRTAVCVDKKGSGDKINIILLEEIGKALIKEINKAEV